MAFLLRDIPSLIFADVLFWGPIILYTLRLHVPIEHTPRPHRDPIRVCEGPSMYYIGTRSLTDRGLNMQGRAFTKGFFNGCCVRAAFKESMGCWSVLISEIHDTEPPSKRWYFFGPLFWVRT